MILAVGRAEKYSPNSIDKDAAILNSVCREFRRQSGQETTIISETMLYNTDSDDGCKALVLTEKADCIISMARSKEAMEILGRRETEGTPVINAPMGVVLACNRRKQTEVLRSGGVSVPEEHGRHGVWLKRAVGTAETAIDVQFAANDEERIVVEQRMREAGITDIMTSAHVEGDLVKFYGVRHTDFFSTHYPADDGDWKFGDERHNGKARHYAYDAAELHSMADKAAQLTGLTVYGGDCIIGSDGSITIIDFNDWPSFSRCRAEAAAAIAESVNYKLRHK